MKRRILNMDPEEFSKLKYNGAGFLVEKNTEPHGIQLINRFAMAKYESTDLVDLAREIQRADVLVRATACSKLQMIAEQVRFLQQQAHKVLLEAKENSELHHAACNFRKLPGHTYYLYKRPSGQHYFSMLSPEDWESSRGGPPHVYVGAYRLEQDLSWTPENRFQQPSLMDKLFSSEDVSF
ncbi:uncharacterized protein C1orf50 homolog isoform X2 [Zootermopsis nevadensis]|uniref:DUF2452 domain-containing protein n=1 Tax=Zootermopsis nevadensis TaxID=136037 RepID=A0A067RI74_ZOONE|nr:uncharacterized protein C1orf50 homolog isoform X2 [Zootermopsis nevadensis]KDR18966.1 hypothetical protein L798_05845 [Zootermopsis nevadensis]